MSLGIADKLNEQYSQLAAQDALREWYARPSGLGGCLREMACRLAGMEAEPRSPESMRVLELGHQRGRELAVQLKKAYPDAVVCDCGAAEGGWDCLPRCATSLQIPTPWTAFMPGNFDAWIPSIRTIVDFKTAGAFAMGLLLSGERDADEGYALQLNAYRWGIQNRVSLGGLDDCAPPISSIRTVLVYEAKDSDARKGIKGGMLVEQEIPYTPELEQRYQERLKAIWELIQAQNEKRLDPLAVSGMPPDVKGRQHWKCRMENGKPLYCSIGTIKGSCS